MSSPDIPPDNSAQVAQMQIQQQKDAQAAQDKKDADAKAALATLRSSAGTAGTQSARDYFTQQGLDPDAYNNDITTRINSIMSSIAPDDPNPGSYFSNVGQTTFDSAQDAARTKASRALTALLPANFETSRVPLNLDDPYLSTIENEQRTKADAIIQNMLSRGVITASGQTAAEADLDKQTPGVRAQLNTIGTGSITGEQEALRNIANKGQTDASTLNLGTTFDPNSYSTQVDQNFNDFINTLGDTLRSKAPGNLFNTSGLGAIAGAGQGAQNTAFDPNAVNGIIDPSPDDTNKTNTTNKTSIF